MASFTRRTRILALLLVIEIIGGYGLVRWKNESDDRARKERLAALAARYKCPTDLVPELPRPDDAEAAASGARLVEVASAEFPTSISFLDDAVAIVTTQKGLVLLVRPDGSTDTVLDLSDDIVSGGEQGLLGSAIDVDGGLLYLDYTDTDGNTRVVAHPINETGAVEDEALEILRVEQPHRWHNAGGLALDGDGHLFVTLGDGGAQADPFDNGQTPATPLGAVLRIIPTPGEGEGHAVPDDNPFVDRDDADPRLWAWGLRNPWRVALDGDTLFIADVGDGCFEEIDVLPADDAGANFGWRRVEGPWEIETPPADHRPPLFSYPRTGGACAVIGGHVYRGTALPELVGRYLFADHCLGEIMTLDPDSGAVEPLGVSAPTITSFGEGPDGETWVLTLAGQIYRMEPAAP